MVEMLNGTYVHLRRGVHYDSSEESASRSPILSPFAVVTTQRLRGAIMKFGQLLRQQSLETSMAHQLEL